MLEPKKFSLKLRFSGDGVDMNGLDLYNGASSFDGFSRALQIVAHAYMTGEIVSRATALRGAKMYFESPRRGSVLFDIITIAEQYPVTAGFSAAIFYDFVKLAFAKATGLFGVAAQTPAVQKLSVDETFFDQLAETLEGSLRRAHRAIDNGVDRVTLERPRSELVVFDRRSSQWVNTRDENPEVMEFTGNVTRYNSITGNGRAFVRELERVMPFRLGENFPAIKCGILSWSLHGNTVAGEKELRFWASKIESATNEPKRLILADCAYRNQLVAT